MGEQNILYYGILLAGVFIGAVSQVMLKKAAMRQYSSPLREYLNPLVIFAYILFVGTTLLSILAYRVVPLLEATSYLYVTFFGVVIFHETINFQKIMGLGLIIAGIAVYALFG